MAIVTRGGVQSKSVVYAELNDEAVLLNVETGMYFGLDPLGSEIWKLMGEGVSQDEIVARLLSEYEISAEQLRADIAEFLSQLEAHGLIEASQG